MRNWWPFRRGSRRAQSRIATGTLAPGAPLSEAFDVLVLLAAELAAVTEEDLERVERDLKPIGGGETRVGVIHRIEVRRACALIEVLRGRAEKANWEGNYVAISDDEKLRFAEEGNPAPATRRLHEGNFLGAGDAGCWVLAIGGRTVGGPEKLGDCFPFRGQSFRLA